MKREIKKNNSETSLEKLTKQVAKGGGINFFGKLIGRLFKFMLQVFLTRALGASAYGLYVLGQSVLNISIMFSLFGVPKGIIRFGSIYNTEGDKKRLKGVLLFGFLISFIISILLSVILFVKAEFLAIDIFHNSNLIEVIKIIILSLPFLTLIMLCVNANIAFKRMDKAVAVEFVFYPLINLILLGIVFLLGYKLIGALYAFVFATIISAFLSFYLLYRIFPDLLSTLEPEWEIYNLLRFSSRMILIGFSYFILLGIDRLMLGYFGVSKDVGIYSAAMLLGGQIGVFHTSIGSMFSPIIPHLFYKRKISELNKLFKSTTKWSVSLVLPIFVGFSLFSKQILSLYGPEFTAGWMVLIIFSLAKTFGALVGASPEILIMSGRENLEMLNSVSLAGLNILLNYILIPRHGILGAVIATSISVSLIGFIRLLEVYLIYNIHPYKISFIKPLISGLIIYIIGFSINYYWEGGRFLWVIKFILLIICYLLLIYLLGFDKEDRVILEGIRKKLKAFG